MSLDLSVWMDAVICDYNYVFDPNVYLKRFFGENISGKYLFLIDEAHNLVERGREMYSASICLEDTIQIRKFIKPYSQKLWKKLGKVVSQLKELQNGCDSWKVQGECGGTSDQSSVCTGRDGSAFGRTADTGSDGWDS